MHRCQAIGAIDVRLKISIARKKDNLKKNLN
jgi:hypothetical protein